MTRKEIENLITTVIRQNDMRNRQGKNLLDVFNGLLDYIQSESEESGEITDIRNLLNTCVCLPAYDSQSYKITFTTIAGASVEIDLPIEQLALRYNPETESIEFDGRRNDGRRCQGAQDRPESRHAGHSMDARRRSRRMGGVHSVYHNCEIRWTK